MSTLINISAVSIRLAAMGFKVELNQESLGENGARLREEAKVVVMAPKMREKETSVSELIFRAWPERTGRTIHSLAEMRVNYDKLTSMEDMFRRWLDNIALPQIQGKRLRDKLEEEKQDRQDKRMAKYREKVGKLFVKHGDNAYPTIVTREVNNESYPVGIVARVQIPGDAETAHARYLVMSKMISGWKADDLASGFPAVVPSPIRTTCPDSAPNQPPF